MFKFSRILIAYAIAVPLACFLGFLVTVPGTFSFGVIGMLLFFFAIPIILKWHHAIMIVLWNSAFVVMLLPGQPQIWLVCAALSFGISFLNHIVFQKKFLPAPELTRPLIFLAGVVLFTAWYRGGIGIRALGGTAYGGRYYIFILLAIAGYFAFTAEPIPIAKGVKMGGLYFLSGLTAGLGNLVYALGPAAYILYYLVPSNIAMTQAASDYGMTTIDRISGLWPASNACFLFLLARYGIRGLFDMTHPWRLPLFCVVFASSFFAGFRSGIIELVMIFSIQFYLEGLLQTRLLPVIIGLAICGMVPVVFFSDSMPKSVQRAICFLPVTVDSEVLQDAQDSSQWRFEMWAMVVKEVPKYLIIGKGYAIDPSLLAMVVSNEEGETANPFESFTIGGDYHNGPLSVIMPFGLFGMFGFIWVLIGGYRVLSSNRRFGDARLRRINTTLLACYLTNCIAFFLIFGAFNTQMNLFLGLCGLSVSLNGGVRRRAVPETKPVSVPQTLAMEPG